MGGVYLLELHVLPWGISRASSASGLSRVSLVLGDLQVSNRMTCLRG
jgi:hypothetical protein